MVLRSLRRVSSITKVDSWVGYQFLLKEEAEGSGIIDYRFYSK